EHERDRASGELGAKDGRQGFAFGDELRDAELALATARALHGIATRGQTLRGRVRRAAAIGWSERAAAFANSVAGPSGGEKALTAATPRAGSTRGVADPLAALGALRPLAAAGARDASVEFTLAETLAFARSGLEGARSLAHRRR